jgi:hypothetical protein
MPPVSTFYAPVPMLDQTVTVSYPALRETVRSLVTGQTYAHT